MCKPSPYGVVAYNGEYPYAQKGPQTPTNQALRQHQFLFDNDPSSTQQEHGKHHVREVPSRTNGAKEVVN